ncbi:hypothetical protein [Streptomyces sp. ICC1]|nr:hypothetical protein [Streptomyces sp. ICC1]
MGAGLRTAAAVLLLAAAAVLAGYRDRAPAGTGQATGPGPAA